MHWIEYERGSVRTVKHAKLPISSFDQCTDSLQWVSESYIKEMLAHLKNGGNRAQRVSFSLHSCNRFWPNSEDGKCNTKWKDKKNHGSGTGQCFSKRSLTNTNKTWSTHHSCPCLNSSYNGGKCAISRNAPEDCKDCHVARERYGIQINQIIDAKRSKVKKTLQVLKNCPTPIVMSGGYIR